MVTIISIFDRHEDFIKLQYTLNPKIGVSGVLNRMLILKKDH